MGEASSIVRPFFHRLFNADGAAVVSSWGPQSDQVGEDSSVISLEMAPIDSVARRQADGRCAGPEEMVEQKETPVQPIKQREPPKEQPPPEPAPSAIALPQGEGAAGPGRGATAARSGDGSPGQPATELSGFVDRFGRDRP